MIAHTARFDTDKAKLCKAAVQRRTFRIYRSIVLPRFADVVLYQILEYWRYLVDFSPISTPFLVTMVMIDREAACASRPVELG